MRGGTEAYLAWSEQPLAKGTAVLVFNSRGERAVDVMEWNDPLRGPWRRGDPGYLRGAVMLGYRVPAPDEAMLISGAKGAKDGTPFRVVTGHGAFVLPMFRHASFLTLAMREAEVAEQCVTKQGIALQAKAVIAFKVGNDPESIVNAAQRFLSDQDQMSMLTGRIFAGHLRSIVGSMTVEEIVTERQKLATEVLDGSKAEMAKMGLIVDSLQIQSIDDMGAGLHRCDGDAAHRGDPAPGEDRPGAGQPGRRRGRAGLAAQAGRVRPPDRDRAGAVQGRGRQGPGGGRAGRPAGAGQRSARGDRTPRPSSPSARPQLRQQQLVAEVVKPAEADAEKVRVLAKADAERMKIQAEAAASYNRVALDRMLIDQLPQIVREAAGGLANANINVLNGAEGLGQIAAGLVGQGLTIFESVKANLAASDGFAAGRPELPADGDGSDDGAQNGAADAPGSA